MQYSIIIFVQNWYDSNNSRCIQGVLLILQHSVFVMVIASSGLVIMEGLSGFVA